MKNGNIEGGGQELDPVFQSNETNNSFTGAVIHVIDDSNLLYEYIKIATPALQI